MQNIKLKFHVELLKPDIIIKPKHILFPVLPEREKANLLINLKNSSNEDLICEWITPPNILSGLIIMPKVFEIKSGNIITCVLEYKSNFRPYGPFSFEEIQKEIIEAFGLDAINNANFNKDLLNGDNLLLEEKSELKNPLMEEKLKKEIDSILNVNSVTNEKDKKKSAELKKKDEKKTELKKDKKQIEEEERKTKELLDKKLQDEEERRYRRIQEFDRDKELKMFGCEKHNFDNEDYGKSEHSKFIIPLYYKPAVKEENDFGNNFFNQGDTSSEVYNYDGANVTGGFKSVMGKSMVNNNSNNENESNLKNTNIHFSSSTSKTMTIKKNNNVKMTFIEVSTTTIEKDLIFDKEEIDFGEVSVKTRKTTNITLTNRGNKPAILKMKPLIVSNCFQVVNAVRDIPPGGVFNFLIDFYPLKDLPYFDEFIVYTNETQSTIKLKGIGVQPEIEILGIENNVLFMGNSMVYNFLEKSFEIQNKSNFSVDYDIKVLKSGKKNKNGYKPFTYVPYKGCINANGKITIKISFFGDHQDFLNFFELILIDVPNQKKPNKIYIQAACWNRQLFWKETIVPIFPNEKFFKINTEQDFFSDTLKINKLNISNLNPNSNERILLEFLKYTSENMSKEEIEKTTKRKITIGNCKLNDPKNEKGGAYEIIMNKDDIYFTCDNNKGTVNAGSEVNITFMFKKPARDPLLKDLVCLNDIGMWITTKAELKLVGGFLNVGANDAVSIEILLRAYIEQI